MPPSELRKEAREALKGKWKKAVYITLAFLAISMLMGFVQGFFKEGSAIYIILEFAFLVVEIPLSFGLLISFIKLKRNENVNAFDFLKEGFSRFAKSWGIWFHTFIKLILPVVCLFLTALLMSSLGIVNVLTQSNLTLTLISVVLFITSIVYVACRSLLYIIAYNISYDNPELTSKACVIKSAELMKGNRGNYFMLELSFIGWAILAVFTLGIGMLLLAPYMQIATICFYERVSNVEVKKSKKTRKTKKIEE